MHLVVFERGMKGMMGMKFSEKIIRNVKIEITRGDWNVFVGIVRMEGKTVQQVLGDCVLEMIRTWKAEEEAKFRV